MESPPTPHGPDVDRLKVPEDLLNQVHAARERFHAAKAELERAMDDSDYNHGEHVKQRFAEVRKAEGELEELNKQVQEILGRKVN